MSVPPIDTTTTEPNPEDPNDPVAARESLRIWHSPIMQQFALIIAGGFIASVLALALIIGIASDSILGALGDREGVPNERVERLDFGADIKTAERQLGRESSRETTFTRRGVKECRTYHIINRTASDTWELCFVDGKLAQKQLRVRQD